jgi:glycosyltransferase involved in cell wall biosynthesis
LIKKVDLVMWAKDGSKTLTFVLKRINEVISEEVVNNRIFIDDYSVDNTREIAKSFGWKVFFNERGGISNGANTALKHVTSDFFISFEQDLVLAKEWWEKIPKHLFDANVAVASGVRLPNQPIALRKLQEYATERYRGREKEVEPFLYGKTLDNTNYKADVVRRLGNFPKLSVSAGVNNVLAQRIHLSGYRAH